MTAQRNVIGAVLTSAGVLAFLINAAHYPDLNPWSLLFVFATSTGALVWMHHRRVTKWFVACVPWWMMSNSSGWIEFGAALLTLGGLIALAVGPTLPGRRRGRKAPPLPQLANGPLTHVEPRTFQASVRSKFLDVATVVLLLLAVALFVAAGVSDGDMTALTAALGLSALIIGATFGFSNWFAGRVRLRIDERGLHSRVMFGEQTIAWNEIAGLTLRYVLFPGMGVRIVYYVTYSSTHEFAFSSSMKGAKDLQAVIEAATGLVWDTPEFESNF